MTVAHLIYRSAGAPATSGATPGICRTCGAAAVYDPLHEDAGTWCPVHGVVLPGDYPPTPRMAALLVQYDQQWSDAPDEEE